AARRPVKAFQGWQARAPSRPGLAMTPPPTSIEQTAASVPTLPGAIAAPPPPAVAPAPAVIRDEGPRAAKPERIRAGGEFRDAQLLRGPAPVVPQLARERRIYGNVKLEATISKEGIVTTAVVVSGHAMLAEAARQAILARRYRPATLNGEPVEVKMPIQVVFVPGR